MHVSRSARALIVLRSWRTLIIAILLSAADGENEKMWMVSVPVVGVFVTTQMARGYR